MILACTLIAILDGDTLRAACPDILTIRLADVDAPERRACPLQAEAAARALAALTAGGFAAQPLYRDRWGRVVATITLPGGADAGAALTRAGAVQPWPHNGKGRALAPRPRGC